jgi:hypothetical protein
MRRWIKQVTLSYNVSNRWSPSFSGPVSPHRPARPNTLTECEGSTLRAGGVERIVSELIVTPRTMPTARKKQRAVLRSPRPDSATMPMPRSPGRPTVHASAEEEMRHQEVFRAYRELSAYFRGRRTEREARAALKIIKAFIREREQMAPADRRPLGPGTVSKSAVRRDRKKPSHSKKVARRRPQSGESKPRQSLAVSHAGGEPPVD